MEEHRFSRRYLVKETQFSQPAGVPYIQAEVADDIHAELWLRGEGPLYTADELVAEPSLIEALKRWRAGEDPVHRAEIAAEEEHLEIDATLFDMRVEEVHRIKDTEGIPFEDAYERVFGHRPVGKWS